MSVRPEIPAVCPVCGAYSLAPEGEMSTLLAVCDVLVTKVLEQLGKYLVRVERARSRQSRSHPWHECHTLWPPDDALVDKVLRGAWDVVPPLIDAHGCCGITSVQVTQMLDQYVHDLAITGTKHNLEELAYRFSTRLGFPVYLYDGHEHYDPEQVLEEA